MLFSSAAEREETGRDLWYKMEYSSKVYFFHNKNLHDFSLESFLWVQKENLIITTSIFIMIFPCKFVN